MNPLEEFMKKYSDLPVHKWMHYLDIYHTHFAALRERPINMLEIGVQGGGSLQMWRHYFGPSARIWGMDCDVKCQALTTHLKDDKIKILIGDQANRTFLRQTVKQLPPLDLVIDDGGHTFPQQINSFEELFPHVVPGGIYLVEDTHTSYWSGWGGGVNSPHTFVAYAKRLVDQVNAWHIPGGSKSQWTDSIQGITFYDSIVVIQKKLHPGKQCPRAEKWGKGTLISVGPSAPNQ